MDMQPTGDAAQEGAKELRTRLTGALDAVKDTPRVADEGTAAYLDDLLRRDAMHITLQVGVQVSYKHAWFAVVRIDYPYIVLEFVSTSTGHEHQDATVSVGERLCFHAAYWTVREIQAPYVVLECTGITDALKNRIARAQAKKQMQEAGKTTVKVGTGTVKVRRSKKARWRK